RALSAYRSQMAVMGRFLRSFLRRDELFGILSPSEVSAAPPQAAEGLYLSDWRRFLPVIADCSKDTLLRDINGSGDVTAIYAVAGPERLHLRLVTRKPL